MIRFEDLKEVEISEFNGGSGVTRGRMFIDDNSRIMKAVLEKGSSIGTHCHKDSSEIVYIISGEAKCRINGKDENVKAGECHYCPKGSSHSIINNSDESLVMFCVVSNQK